MTVLSVTLGVVGIIGLATWALYMGALLRETWRR